MRDLVGSALRTIGHVRGVRSLAFHMKFHGMLERKLWRIAIFVMAAAIAPVIWFGALDHPKYRPVTVQWLISSMESDAVSSVDGKRVAVSGEVEIDLFAAPGKANGYHLIVPSTWTSWRNNSRWINVMPTCRARQCRRIATSSPCLASCMSVDCQPAKSSTPRSGLIRRAPTWISGGTNMFPWRQSDCRRCASRWG